MSVMRVHKTRDFTVMSNTHLRDKALSLKAKGLLSVMLSLPDDWDYSVAGLCSIVKEGRSAVETALRELMDAGYVRRTKLYPNQTDSGHIEYEYDIYEVPWQARGSEGIDLQGVEDLPLEDQAVENSNQLKTEKPRTEKPKTEKQKTEKRKTGYGKGREARHKYGEYGNVLLSDSDLDKLRGEFPSDWQARVERLSEYISMTGREYRNHLAVIRNWARRDKECERSHDRDQSRFMTHDYSETKPRIVSL